MKLQITARRICDVSFREALLSKKGYYAKSHDVQGPHFPCRNILL